MFLKQPLKTQSLCMVLSAAALVGAGASQAAEVGIVRALQKGPIGDSPQFSNPAAYEAEGAITMRRAFGKYTVNGDPDSKLSSAGFMTKVALGGGIAPTKNFALTAFADLTLASDYDEEQNRRIPKSTFDSGLYRNEIGTIAIIRSNPLVAGAGISLLAIGRETKEFVFNGDKYVAEIGSAAMPVLRAFGGISLSGFEATAGIRLFSMGDAEVNSKDPVGRKSEFDIVRRNPGELHADALLKVNKNIELGAALAYVLTGQASEHLDEFSMMYAENGNSRTRLTGGARRNANHIRAGVGGRFAPNSLFSLAGAVQYIGASYAEDEYASLEHENLGGIKLDLGTDVNIQRFRGFFQAGYMVETSHSFQVTSDARSDTHVQGTLKSPFNNGDRVKMNQGHWNLALGGGIAI